MDTYEWGARITGMIAFIGFWIYAIASYGIFLGGGLGWIPAAFLGVAAGLLWPLIVAALTILAILIAIAL